MTILCVAVHLNVLADSLTRTLGLSLQPAIHVPLFSSPRNPPSPGELVSILIIGGLPPIFDNYLSAKRKRATLQTNQ